MVKVGYQLITLALLSCAVLAQTQNGGGSSIPSADGGTIAHFHGLEQINP